jgi:phage terminase small subunit
LTAEHQPTVQEQLDAALAGLTARQRDFVEQYLVCLNATEAARRAGYTHPNKQGPRLLVNVGIQVAVSAGLALRAMPADEVLARLADMAQGSADDFVTVYQSPLHDVTGQPILDRDGQPIVRYFPSLDLEKARERGMLHLVKKVTYTAHGPSVELYDAQAALALLAKHHGLLVERVDQTGALTIKVVYADNSDIGTP